MTDKPWKLVSLLAGIFLLGAVTGGIVSVRLSRGMMQQRVMPEQWGPSRLKLLRERLDLTSEQIERLRPIIKTNTEHLAKLRQSGFDQTRQILEQMEKDIAAVLTPDQKAKYEQMNREMRERLQRFMRERPGPGPGGPFERGPRGDRPPGDFGPDGPPMPPPNEDGSKPTEQPAKESPAKSG